MPEILNKMMNSKGSETAADDGNAIGNGMGWDGMVVRIRAPFLSHFSITLLNIMNFALFSVCVCVCAARSFACFVHDVHE